MSFSETMKLPSRGIIYQNCPEDIEVTAFTTKAYKDLLASNATEAGFRQFIDTCLINCPVKGKDLHQNDLLAILFKIRAMTLGSNLKTQVTCSSCGSQEEVVWDLDDLSVKYLYVDTYPIPVTLPKSNKDVRIKFLTGDLISNAKRTAEKRAAKFNKPVKEFETIYRTVSGIEVDGLDLVSKAEWYEKLHPVDAIYLDQAFSELSDTFGINLMKDCKCSKCDHEYKTFIDIGSDFFRTNATVKTGITSKIGTLAESFKESNITD